MPCISACEMAQRDYWHLQRLAISSMVERTQPQLERAPRPDGQTPPLTIRWAMHFPEHYLASRPFNIQYQYVDHQGEEEEDQEGDMEEDLEEDQSQEEEKEQDKEKKPEASPWFNLADYDCDEYYVCEILEALIPYTQYRVSLESEFFQGFPFHQGFPLFFPLVPLRAALWRGQRRGPLLSSHSCLPNPSGRSSDLPTGH